MAIVVNRLHPLFAAELLGAKLSEEPAPELIAAVNAAMNEYGVVVLRNQRITDDEQVRFARCFGPLELPPHMGLKTSAAAGAPAPASPAVPRRHTRPELYDVSNLDADGEILPAESLRHASNRANEEFHTDSSFNSLPTKWSILSGRVLPPEGGDTEFVDTRAAFDALPAATKIRACGAVAEHWFWKTRGRAGYTVITEEMKQAMPAVPQPLVRVIPESGRAALYIGNHATHIIGWPRADGERFLQELNEFATQPRFVYLHKWQPDDLLIWDNRCTLHRATGYDVFKYKRDLRRATINEFGAEISSTAALGVPPPA
jgi:alpha-ketoglutarate-dependent 2,4-dichlorophenoxyacetate dioxygenase